MKVQQQVKHHPSPTYLPFLPRDPLPCIQGTHKTRNYFPTNNIMINPQKQTIYLPAFLRLKFKNFTDLDIGRLSALLNGEIVLVVYYGELFEVFGRGKEKEVEKCLMRQVVMLFARDNAIKLTMDERDNEERGLDIKASHNIQQHEVKFIVKKSLTLNLDSQVFLTPFQLINGILEITLKSVKLNYPYQGNQTKQFKIQFNLQNNWNIEEKVEFKNWGTFGNYDLAEKRIGAVYTNYRISEGKEFRLTVGQRVKREKGKRERKEKEANEKEKEKEKQRQRKNNSKVIQVKNTPHQPNPMNTSTYPLNLQQPQPIINQLTPSQISPLIQQQQIKIQPFHYAYFNIPLYKFPLSAIVTIFAPLFFLDILNFGILFQDKSLNDRIAAIATLVLAFAALVPTIRSQIPPNPTITLVEMLVYLQTLPTILAIIQSLDVVDMFSPQSTQSFKYDWANNGYFWVALMVSLVTFVIILGLTVFHYCKWYPEYNDVADGSKKVVFDRTRWRNTECNRYFDELFQQEVDDKERPTVVILKAKKV